MGKTKSRESLPLDDDRVEDQLLRMVQNECQALGVDRAVGARILDLLISESKRVQAGGVEQKQLITPMVIANKARDLERRGEKILRLDIGEPDFDPPRAVLDACSEALFSFKTHYTQTRGIPPLLEALGGYLKRKYGFAAQENELIVTPGGRYGTYAALASLLDQGDRCIVIEPNWPAYREVLQFIGARATVIPTRLEEEWRPSIEAVKERIFSNTKAMVLSYPANPTGKIISPKAFDELVGVANDHGITVVSDEIYTEYSYMKCPTILKSAAQRFILTASFSKTWAMTGFRVGYAYASPQTVSKMASIQALQLTSVAEFIQHGAIKALEVDAEVKRNAASMKERIDSACEELDRLPDVEYYRPDGAMYVFPRVKKPGFEASELTMRALQEKKVSITPGSGFGAYPEFFRVSLGGSKETIVEGIRRLGEAIR